MKIYLQVVLNLLLLPVMLGCQGERTKGNHPNILLILTDDQAYGDLSIMGNSIAETPNLDVLAKEGVLFENFYVSPVCAPTRASLLTGRYHQKTGVSGVTRGRENMNLDETTLADILKENGYATGIFGKWHNGAHYPYHPLGRGFDEFVGFASGHWSNYFDTTIERNGSPFYAEGYLPDVLTEQAINFMRDQAASNTPFLCYLPYQTPHTPLQVPDKYFDKYKNKGIDDFNATIYGMGENIDDHIGELLTELDRLHIRENTIILYISDNGPLNLRYNKGLKGKKGQVDEGGVRVPFILNWKNNIESREPVSFPLAHIDILPTLLGILDIDYNGEKELDGINFEQLLTESTPLPSRDLFMEWGGHQRVLSGEYLMVDEQLYAIKNDPGQVENIREKHPEIYDSMLKSFDKWERELPAQKIVKEIPVGHSEFLTTVLPAHEANLYPPFEFRKDRRETGIAYHSVYGWAHDWIDYWTKTSAYAEWDLEVFESGNYQIEFKYALARSDAGVKIAIDIGNERILMDHLPFFEHEKRPSYDRIPRQQEAPETNWASANAGLVYLEKGPCKLMIQSIDIPGNKSIELKEIILKKLVN